MKKIYFLVFVFLVCSFLFTVHFGYAQSGQWVWLHGSNTSNSAGNFGTLGVPSPTNDPPAMYEPCQRTDNNGNFWLFSGEDGWSNDYAALWKYDVSTNEWTWMKGPSTGSYLGNYGTKGVPSPNNNPPARFHGSATWTDTTGNLWLFGGATSINDLWEYNVATNEWTWMKGADTINQSGVYGAQGVPDTANTPGARWECASAWTDNSNNLWLFGGYNVFNDLWRYNIQTSTWTWMKGSNLPHQLGVYGTLGVEDSLNTPGARASYSHWKDVNGNLWLFGGGFSAIMNDFWRFNLVTNNWTWMGGDSIGGSAGTYGTRCISDSTNIPGERSENRAVWTDQSGNFWMFGGTTDYVSNILNDLWMYCFRNKQWIWVSGDTTTNTAGNWGTQGVWSTANKPNGRMGAVSWTGLNGHLYLFGGSASPWNTPYNDLWEFAIDTSCGGCSATSLMINEAGLNEEIRIYPNPATQYVNIDWQLVVSGNIGITIMNVLGEKVYSRQLQPSNLKPQTINCKSLASGIYFVKVSTEKMNWVGKFVKE